MMVSIVPELCCIGYDMTFSSSPSCCCMMLPFEEMAAGAAAEKLENGAKSLAARDFPVKVRTAFRCLREALKGEV